MVDDYMTRYAQREAEQHAKAKAAILAKAEALKAAGVLCIVAEFRGDGDEGSIERFKYFDAIPEDPDDEPTINEDAIPNASKPDEEDFYSLLPGGFDQNEGSQGTLVFDVEAKKFTVNVGWNYTETRNETSEV